jgi:hypothetical protein
MSRQTSSTSRGGSGSSPLGSRWRHDDGRAAAEVRDKVLETGAERVDASRRRGNEALDRARSLKGRVSSTIAERAIRRRDDDHERDEQG